MYDDINIQGRGKMLKICLCDDNPIHMQKTTSIIYKELSSRDISYSLHEYSTLEQLNEILDKNTFRFDLVLLDVDFNGKTSIPLAKKINKISPGSYIIYISNYLTYVKDIFDTDFIYYIIKDELETRFPNALDKTLSFLENQPKLKIQKKNKIYILNQNDIMYFERDLRVTHIVLKDRTITITERLDDLIDRLDLKHFIRCHRSYIVNVLYLHEYSYNSLIMKNDYTIPISRKYQNEMKAFLLNYNEE